MSAAVRTRGEREAGRTHLDVEPRLRLVVREEVEHKVAHVLRAHQRVSWVSGDARGSWTHLDLDHAPAGEAARVEREARRVLLQGVSAGQLGSVRAEQDRKRGRTRARCSSFLRFLALPLSSLESSLADLGASAAPAWSEPACESSSWLIEAVVGPSWSLRFLDECESEEATGTGWSRASEATLALCGTGEGAMVELFGAELLEALARRESE